MALRWIFTADTGPFRKGLNQMRTETKAFSNAITRTMAGIFSAGAIVAGFRNWIRSMDELAKRAQKLGASAESLQRVEFIASKSNINAQQLAALLVRLERRFGEAARGSKSFAEAIKNLGLERVAASDPEGAILALSQAWKQAEGSGTEYADLLKLLDTEARELIPLLRQGPEAIAEGMAKAAVVSEKTIKRVERFNDSLTDLRNRAQVGFAFVFNGLKFLGDFIGSWVGAVIANFQRLFRLVGTQWRNLGDIIRNVFKGEFDLAREALQRLVNENARAANDMGAHWQEAAKLTAESWEDAFGRTAQAARKAAQEATRAAGGGADLFTPGSNIGTGNRGGPFGGRMSPKDLADWARGQVGNIVGAAGAAAGFVPTQGVPTQSSSPPPRSVPVTSLQSIGGATAAGGLAQNVAREGLKIASLSLATLGQIAQNTARMQNGTKPVAEPNVP